MKRTQLYKMTYTDQANKQTDIRYFYAWDRQDAEDSAKAWLDAYNELYGTDLKLIRLVLAKA